MIAALVIAYLLVGVVVGLSLMLQGAGGQITDFTDLTLVGLGAFFCMFVWPAILFIVALGYLGKLVTR